MMSYEAAQVTFIPLRVSSATLTHSPGVPPKHAKLCGP
eukprot:CAMPEP_0115451544 /NCGR_PEP_ID=MMETSP0271-20121206/42124_1 /TAXON_ID=71861 /ORGANISM="Scrippsiella trochoidea, Strain CCMP3099" /LENGTH=37 /DNA_ID= /DNA_START= /DNA_END= /DNA_ORIENTATION=